MTLPLARKIVLVLTGQTLPPGMPPVRTLSAQLPARIQVTPDTEVEGSGTEGRADTAVDVDFGGGAVRERDALGRGADVELQVLVHIVARLEIGGDRRVVVGLGDAAEDVVVHDRAPKAISQGSNGAGGGALTAFRGISAAKAEPAVIASTAATKTSFFMTIPITFKNSPVPTPQGTSDNRLQPNS